MKWFRRCLVTLGIICLGIALIAPPNQSLRPTAAASRFFRVQCLP